jgi:serine protease AprX
LPETETAAAASLLARLKSTADDQLNALLKAHAGATAGFDSLSEQPPDIIRQFIEAKISDEQIISHSYKHVDGTSFAAPIVSSVVAQMLEANSALTPQQVKRILIDTAERLPDVPTDQQGWGAIIAARAVECALQLIG